MCRLEVSTFHRYIESLHNRRLIFRIFQTCGTHSSPSELSWEVEILYVDLVGFLDATKDPEVGDLVVLAPAPRYSDQVPPTPKKIDCRRLLSLHLPNPRMRLFDVSANHLNISFYFKHE